LAEAYGYSGGLLHPSEGDEDKEVEKKGGMHHPRALYPMGTAVTCQVLPQVPALIQYGIGVENQVCIPPKTKFHHRDDPEIEDNALHVSQALRHAYPS